MTAESKQVLVQHEGRWWVADLLDQYRSGPDQRWRCALRLNTGPGQNYMLAVWADDCRPVDDPPPGWTDPRATDAATPLAGPPW